MYRDIPEGLGLRKEANAWARLFQQAIKRFPKMSLRNATALTNQRYAHKTMGALERLHQSRVNRAGGRVGNVLMGDGDPNKFYSAVSEYNRTLRAKPQTQGILRGGGYYQNMIGIGKGDISEIRRFQSLSPETNKTIKNVLRHKEILPTDATKPWYVSPFKGYPTHTIPESIQIPPVK